MSAKPMRKNSTRYMTEGTFRLNLVAQPSLTTALAAPAAWRCWPRSAAPRTFPRMEPQLKHARNIKPRQCVPCRGGAGWGPKGGRGPAPLAVNAGRSVFVPVIRCTRLGYLPPFDGTSGGSARNFSNATFPLRRAASGVENPAP